MAKLRTRLERADADLYTTKKGAAAMKQKYEQVGANDLSRRRGICAGWSLSGSR